MKRGGGGAFTAGGQAEAFLTFHVPNENALLAAIGRVALAQSNLDHALKLMIKTLAGVSTAVALADTEFEGSRGLRERARKLAKSRFGESAAKMQLGELLKRCGEATARRNELLHRVWVRDHYTEEQGTSDGLDDLQPLPTVDELEALAGELIQLMTEVQHERLAGYVAQELLNADRK